TPEQPTPSASQENKPEEERGDGDGTSEGAEEAGTESLLDIQTKQQTLQLSDDEEEDPEDEDEEEEQVKKSVMHVSALCSATSPTATAISIRLKFLNDTEEVAVLEPQDTVGVLK
ncbi:hypothetical protein NL108_000595, partial [Boleophthalmus pectinirostris]